MQVGDRVRLKASSRLAGDPKIGPDEIGDVIKTYRMETDGDVERVDVRFPSLELPLIGRLDSEFELLQPGPRGSSY